MRRWVRAALLLLAGSVIVIVALVAYITFAFDPNVLKPRLATWVAGRYQRELRVDGAIEMKFWPRAQLVVNGASLSDREKKAVTFASVQRAFVAVDWLPLLGGEVVAQALTLEGLALNLRRDASGNWNFDDLLRSDANDNTKVDIAQFVLRNAHIELDDQQHAARWSVQKLQLTAGAIAYGRPGDLAGGFDITDAAGQTRATVSFASAYILNATPFTLELKGAELRAQGKVAGMGLEQFQFKGHLLHPAADVWRMSDVKLRAKVRPSVVDEKAAPVQPVSVDAGITNLAWERGQWSGAGIQANVARDTGEQQSLQVRLETLQGRDEISVPAAAFDAKVGDWALQMRAPLSFDAKAATLRSPQAVLSADWQRDGSSMHWRGSGAVSARLPAAEFALSDMAFESDAVLPAGRAHARGNVDLEIQQGSAIASGRALQLDWSDTAQQIRLLSGERATVSLKGDAVSSELSGLRIEGTRGEWRFSGPLATRLSGSLAQQRYALSALSLQLKATRAASAANAAAEENLDLHANASVDINAQSGKLQLSNTVLSSGMKDNIKRNNEVNLDGVLDVSWDKPHAAFVGHGRVNDSKFKGRVAWQLDARRATPSYDFDLDVDRLDWDRYVSAQPAPPRAARTPSEVRAQPSIDVAALRAIRAKGVARIGTLKASGVTAHQVVVEVE